MDLEKAGPRVRACWAWADDMAHAMGDPTPLRVQGIMLGLQLGSALAAIDRPWLVALAHELQDFLEAEGQEQSGQAPAASHVRFSYSDTARQLIARAQQLAAEGPSHD